MSTAAELVMKSAQANEQMALVARHFPEIADRRLIFFLYSREVCARRASKLRKRDNVEVVFMRRTKNGKSRYRWIGKPWAIGFDLASGPDRTAITTTRN